MTSILNSANLEAHDIVRSGVLAPLLSRVPSYIRERVCTEPLFNFGFDDFMIDDTDGSFVARLRVAVAADSELWKLPPHKRRGAAIRYFEQPVIIEPPEVERIERGEDSREIITGKLSQSLDELITILLDGCKNLVSEPESVEA